MELTKTIKIASACVLTVVAIAGGVAYKNGEDYKAKAKAEAAKIEAERIAYANRPIVEATCVMNGYGDGDCKFTNTGKTAGPQCGYIGVNGPGVTTSEVFCSGLVQPYTTTKVDFSIPAVSKLCEDGMKNWQDVCSFEFVKK